MGLRQPNWNRDRQNKQNMIIEKPCSPGHCLKMLNENMRTDILRSVHQRIQVRMDQRDKKSPLEILIESIEEVLGTFEGINLYECVEAQSIQHRSRL